MQDTQQDLDFYFKSVCLSNIALPVLDFFFMEKKKKKENLINKKLPQISTVDIYTHYNKNSKN